MRRRDLSFALSMFLLAGPGAALAQVGGKISEAKPGDVRLLVSASFRVPLEAVREKAQSALGHNLLTEYGASRSLQTQIEGDQVFDLAIVTPNVIDAMVAAGKIVKGSRVDLARVPVAVAQRGGSKVDISTPDKLKSAIISAKLVRYLPIGAAGPTVDNVSVKLGLNDVIKSKTGALINEKEAPLAPGSKDYELIFLPDSELLNLPADQIYLGILPQELQVPVIISAAIGAKGDAKAAKAVIEFLKGPAIEPALASSRMKR